MLTGKLPGCRLAAPFTLCGAGEIRNPCLPVSAALRTWDEIEAMLQAAVSSGVGICFPYYRIDGIQG